MAFKRLPQRRVEVFAGSLIEGIDVKATLRACSRGSEDVYVKSSTLDHQSQISSDDGGEFPVVWLFDPAAGANAEWIALYHEFCSLSYYIQDRGQFEHIVENRGDKLVGSICYGRRAADQEFSLSHFARWLRDATSGTSASTLPGWRSKPANTRQNIWIRFPGAGWNSDCKKCSPGKLRLSF